MRRELLSATGSEVQAAKPRTGADLLPVLAKRFLLLQCNLFGLVRRHTPLAQRLDHVVVNLRLGFARTHCSADGSARRGAKQRSTRKTCSHPNNSRHSGANSPRYSGLQGCFLSAQQVRVDDLSGVLAEISDTLFKLDPLQLRLTLRGQGVG